VEEFGLRHRRSGWFIAPLCPAGPGLEKPENVTQIIAAQAVKRLREPDPKARAHDEAGDQLSLPLGGQPCVHYDLSPLYRTRPSASTACSTLLDQGASVADAPSYPPYDIERTADNAYRVTMAVAGFADIRPLHRERARTR
jgi:hypothetical protein